MPGTNEPFAGEYPSFRGKKRPLQGWNPTKWTWDREDHQAGERERSKRRERDCGRRGLFNRFKKSPIIPRGGRREAVCLPGGVGCNYRERSKWDRRGDVSGNIIFHFNGGLFCLLYFLGLFYLPLNPSLIPFICFSCLRRRFYRGLYHDPVLVPLSPSSSLFLSPLLPLLLLAPAGSTASFYLGANVLIACGRSSRPTRFLPSSISSFSWLLRGHRPPKSLEMRISHSCLGFRHINEEIFW